MKYNVVVATHHKTGTVWMDGVFKAIAGDLGVAYVNFTSQNLVSYEGPLPTSAPEVLRGP